MATIDTIISNARYDIRDTGSSLYDDAELLVYANRALRQLDNALSSMRSDWVFNEGDLTLSTSYNYVAAPSQCIVTREVWIDTKQLIKMTVDEMYRQRRYVSTSYEPVYFAEQGTNILFECTPDDTYSAKIYYDKRSDELSSGDDMPYNGEFNDPIREMIIMLANKRNENEFMSDAEIFNYFTSSALGNVIRRNHRPKKKLDF